MSKGDTTYPKPSFFLFCAKLKKLRNSFCSKPVLVLSQLQFLWYEAHFYPDFGSVWPSCWLYCAALSSVRSELYWQGTMAREHVSKQDILSRELVSTQGTLVREHVRHTIYQTLHQAFQTLCFISELIF